MTTHFWLNETRPARQAGAPENRVYVRQYGNGRAILLAVHGFGRSGARMERLGLQLGDQFTTLAPDLPYHGKTEWYDDRYTPREFSRILQQLLDRYPDRPVFLMGHSLGGRYLSSCLAGLEHPDLRDLVLVAPDGAGGRYTNWIDTLPSMLVRPLARISERPRSILRLSGWLSKRGIINRYSAEYLKSNLNDRPFRRRIAGTLRSVLKFPPRAEAFERALQRHAMVCTVFVGDRDPLLHHDRLQSIYGPLPSVALHHYSGSHWLPERLLGEYYRNSLLTTVP
ncbi:2-succinyl-6-hydroxy-2, 4-cyclohexadiene-1-carboxylate synthase [Neolewinella maritima]|uniref:2-succinyl-6-hydroxy-2, 4-cyclohexadiene-1-carboxylate synthase n=1 Tax=Neolewinella maritima TaxID=1383882 RepID=A0ABM9B2K1_9BACT|nr:alpha/beta fold hydrolase [Neolewinella maritima]CAH1001573.1 2-succinyl-6-hydroxy-2, 4-cyclohexadiene-1-carboxylate synthase [Neolewinella maritima]